MTTLGGMSFKNLLIRSLVQGLRNSPQDGAPSSRFLIISTTGLGDSLWGTPAVRALRNAHPEAYIALLTSPVGAQVFAHNPYLSEIFVVKDPVLLQLPKLYLLLRKRKFTDILLFHTSQRAILPLAATLGAKRLIGTAGLHKGLDDLLTDPILPQYTHEIKRRLDLIALLLPPEASPPSTAMTWHFTSEELGAAHAFLATLPPSPRRILLHPGAKDLFKQWPPDLFAALGKKLSEHPQIQILITGHPGEAPLAQKIAAQIPRAHAITHLPLRTFAPLLKEMDLVITNDTGPMHIAFALQTPTIALFAATDPHLCGPYGTSPRATVIAKSRTCTPCLKKRCPEPFCLLQISPDEVYHAAQAYL